MMPGHRIQQWRKFLSSSANKANLIRFLVAEWKTPNLRGKLNDRQLYVASEETRLHITTDQWGEVACLQSNQEEANTRIILHATVLGDIRGPTQEAASIHMQTVHIILNNSGIRNQESGKLYWAQWPVTLNIHSTECM